MEVGAGLTLTPTLTITITPTLTLIPALALPNPNPDPNPSTLHIPYTGGTGWQAVADERNAQEAGAELQGRRAGEL